MKIRCCAGAAVNDLPLLFQNVLRRRAISAGDQYKRFGYVLLKKNLELNFSARKGFGVLL